MKASHVRTLFVVTAIAVTCTGFESVARSASALSTRGTAATRFGLEINGASAGFVKSAAGGEPVAVVATSGIAQSAVPNKHVANIKFESLTVTAGTGMGTPFYDLIKGTLSHTPQRTNATLTELDADFKEQSRLTMPNALLGEVTFPALDASVRESRYFTVTFQPEQVRYTRGSGAVSAPVRTSFGAGAARGIMSNNFRVKIGSLDCSHVASVEAFTVKWKAVEDPSGLYRTYDVTPTTMEVGDLVITVDEAHAQDFITWRNDWFLNGNHLDKDEKDGTIEYLAPDMKSVLFTVSLKHIGLMKVGGDQMNAGETARKLKVSMYVEDATFAYDRSAAM